MKKIPKIFIGYDSRFPDPYYVLEYSILKHTSIEVQIESLDLSIITNDWDFHRPYDPLQSTEFTYLRFLVPLLSGYSGISLYLDNDMLCLHDIAEVFALPMENCWLRVRKHEYESTNTTKMYGCPQTNYPRKNWSSMMLLNNAKFRELWTKSYVETATPGELHRFAGVPESALCDLPAGWNTLAHTHDGPLRAALLHYTEGGPWFSQYEDCKWADLWKEYYTEYIKTVV